VLFSVNEKTGRTRRPPRNVLPRCNYLLLVVSVVEDWFVDAPWFMVDVALVLLDCWFALTPLVTDWLPSPTCTPGLMLAPAFTAELAMPTLASTPTFGFTLSDWVPEDGVADELVPEVLPDVVPDVLPEVLAPLDWLVLVPWFIVDEEPMSVEDWFALTPLSTVWLPLPMFTPGLTFAPRFTSVLLTPTFASTPTFGFTLRDEVLLVDEGEEALPLVDDDVLPLVDEGDDVLLVDEGDEMLPLLDDGDDVLPLEEDVVPERLPDALREVLPAFVAFEP